MVDRSAGLLCRADLFFGHAGSGGEQGVGGGVQGGFRRVLDDADDETNGDDLHGHVIGDAKQTAGQRDQQQRAASHARGAAGADRRQHTEEDRSGDVHGYTQGVDGRQGQDADGDRRAGHVDGRPQWDRYRVGFLVQTQALAELQVDRDVGGRAAGEEGGQAAFTQAGEDQRVGVAADLPEYDERVDHQGDEQHAADQHHQQVQVVEQGTHAGFGQRGGDQPENPQGREANHQLHDAGHGAGQVGQHLPAGRGRMAQGEAQADGPGQDADEVAVEQCIDRIVHHVQQQRLEDFADAARWAQLGTVADQGQAGRKGEAGDDGNDRRAEGADQVEHEDRADMGLLPALMVGDRRRDQDEYQHRRHGLERGDEYRAEKTDGRRRLRKEQRQGNAGDQADEDLDHQAGAVE